MSSKEAESSIADVELGDRCTRRPTQIRPKRGARARADNITLGCHCQGKGHSLRPPSLWLVGVATATIRPPEKNNIPPWSHLERCTAALSCDSDSVPPKALHCKPKPDVPQLFFGRIFCRLHYPSNSRFARYVIVHRCSECGDRQSDQMMHINLRSDKGEPTGGVG